MKRLPVLKMPYFARRILDIGAGHNPFKGVTHVLDMDIKEGRERGGNRIVVPTTARLIQGEAAALPFRLASFDYVYASHVLEHLDEPDRACREIMRVATAGYIETPSPFLEQGLALNDETPPAQWYHKWFVFAPRQNLLVFEPKTREEVYRFCSCANGRFLQDFYATVDFPDAQHCFPRKAKTTIFYWNSSFEVEVRDRTVDCRKEGRPCRFSGMKAALLGSCNDIFRPHRLMRLRKRYPQCLAVFRRYGHRTLFV